MTQASLSPDLNGALSASPSPGAPTEAGQTPESTLWITALTASGLVMAAVLLLGLLSRNVASDASFGGFVSGVAIMIAAFGIGALAYVLVAAKRQGLIGSIKMPATASTPLVPRGMHVVPALPAEMGRRRRRQLQAERTERSKQAKAIATATAVATKARHTAPSPTRPPTITPRPTPPSVPSPRREVVARPKPQPMAARQARPAPARAVAAPPTTRPTPTLPTQRPPQARSARPVPARPVAARPAAIHMPRPPARQPRPAAWPARAPVVRMATPPVMPRTQVVMRQVGAANIRMQTPSGRRQADPGRVW